MPLNPAAQPVTARSSTSALLANGVSRLEVTLKLTTAILALAAGVYTYLGVRELLNGSVTTVFFAAVIYSVAVSVGIYAFWMFMMQFMPHIVSATGRGLMLGCMLLGSLMIVAMSSWLNASALAGAAAIQQHLAITVQNYTRDLDAANTNAIAAQGLLPDIQLASSRFARLADAERAGSLTGTSGSGTVVQLLTQMSGQLDSLGQQVRIPPSAFRTCTIKGARTCQDARADLDRGPIAQRSDAFATESLALMGVIANLQQTSVAPAVKRAAASCPPNSSRRPPADAAWTLPIGRPRWSARSKARSPPRRHRSRTPRTKFSRCRGSSRNNSSRCRPRKPCCVMPAISFRAGRARSDRPDAGGAGSDPVRRSRCDHGARDFPQSAHRR